MSALGVLSEIYFNQNPKFFFDKDDGQQIQFSLLKELNFEA